MHKCMATILTFTRMYWILGPSCGHYAQVGRPTQTGTLNVTTPFITNTLGSVLPFTGLNRTILFLDSHPLGSD